MMGNSPKSQNLNKTEQVYEVVLNRTGDIELAN